MKTVYGTLTARGIETGGGPERAVGAPRRAALVRRSGRAPGEQYEDNVIDLTAWRAGKAAAAPAEDGDGDPPDGGSRRNGESARRSRREHAAMMAGELLSTLAVLAVAAALLVKILVF